MCVVDAHLLYQHRTGERLSTEAFAVRLAQSLINNTLSGHDEGRPARRRRQLGVRSTVSRPTRVPPQHVLVPLQELPEYQRSGAAKYPRRHCSECKRLTLLFCLYCHVVHAKVVPVCGTNHHTCFIAHADREADDDDAF